MSMLDFARRMIDRMEYSDFFIVLFGISCYTHANSIYLYVFRAAVPVAQAMVRRPDRGILADHGGRYGNVLPCPQAFVCIAKENRQGENCALFVRCNCSLDFSGGHFLLGKFGDLQNGKGALWGNMRV
ncbi:hypothetical protein HMPREF9081_0216 [Centipeda periodontii DSM 2778]|uniref:Uncharacterized protein n=1 Tax=Centipeda periodontii DSM 2778 TaxID=888060 RepID=F5RIN7_9FIRM|nr:hypothetical protein HMPREF9081_0216 [Centipeda periodontii DSM 2778]